MIIVIRTLIAVGLLLGLAVLAVLESEGSERVFDLSISGRKLAGLSNVIRVRQGDVVELRWTADEVVELHLHGYDIETVVEPGAPAAMTFTARATGRFPVTVHRFGERREGGASGGHGHGHGHGEITLLYVEVRPR